jgi:hypothetical protein
LAADEPKHRIRELCRWPLRETLSDTDQVPFQHVQSARLALSIAHFPLKLLYGPLGMPDSLNIALLDQDAKDLETFGRR